MKTIIFIFTIALFFTIQFEANGQRGTHNKDWWEKYRSEKVSFLTDKLDLTPEEAQKFWPIYNQLDKERWEAQKTRRDLENKLKESEESITDDHAIELSKKFISSIQKETDIVVEYHGKLLEVLPPQKVLKFYKAENEFRMYMIRKYRDERKNGKHP